MLGGFAPTGNLKRLEKGDQRLSIVNPELRSKFVAPDRARAEVKAFRDVIFPEPRRIEPFLKCFRLTVMAERIPAPDTPQRRHFVKARSPARPYCRGGFRSHRDIENVVDLSQLIR